MLYFKNKINFLLAFCIIVPSCTFAHSGGTDRFGCHNDNIHGGYHCHNAKSSSGSADIDEGVWIPVLILGVLYLHITDGEGNNLLINSSKKRNNAFKFSLVPANKEKVEGIIFQMSYQF
jgi:hypothetical protein